MGRLFRGTRSSGNVRSILPRLSLPSSSRSLVCIYVQHTLSTYPHTDSDDLKPTSYRYRTIKL